MKRLPGYGPSCLLLALAACHSAPPPPAPETARVAANPAPAPAAPPPARLVLMGTTDLHGWLLPYDYYTGRVTSNGLSLLTPLIDSVRAANPGRTLLLDSGDLLQGNPLDFVYSHLAPGEVHPVVAALNRAGYDAVAIGNHEFNYGIPHLQAALAGARFPWLSANIFRAGSAEHAFRASVLVERTLQGHPLRIGITAVTPPGVAIWDRDRVQGRLGFSDMVASLLPEVAELRRQGAQLVVVAAHSGLEGSSYDTAATGVAAENAALEIARRVPGVDVVFLGHTHRELADTTVNGVLLLQAKNWGASLALATLELGWRGDGWRVESAHGQILRPAAGRADAGLEAALATAHQRTRDYVARRIGSSSAAWSSARARSEDTPIMDLINQVQLRASGAQLSSAAAFTLDARIPAGPVSVAQVAGLYIYDNTLKALRISGAQLRAYLEKSAEYYLPCPGGACPRLVNPAVPGYNFETVSGVDYDLDLTRPLGSRVTRLQYRGRAVAAGDSFSIALNNYRASGSGGYSMLLGAPVVYDRGESIRDLLIAEIERRGRIAPEQVFRRNWRILPAALAERVAAEQAAAQPAEAR